MGILASIQSTIATWIGKVSWKSNRVLIQSESDEIRKLLTANYYIILTRHSGYLSSYAIALAHFFLTGRMGYYSHALMNLEDEVNDPLDFRLIEATGVGTHYSTFNEVFDPQCSSVALLKPKAMTIDEWTAAMDKAKGQLGKPYDTLFDLKNDQALSCVELVLIALHNSPNYDTDFANFEKMISESKNLDPQMFFECEDFEVVYEVRH
jgi:hypothetical protein